MTRTTMRKRSFGWRCTTIGKLSLVRSTPSCTVRVWPARTTSPSAWPPPWSGTASLRAPGRWTFPGSTRRRTTPGGWPASSARTSTPTRVPARRSSAPRSPTVNCTPASSPWPARPSPRCATGPEPAARSGQLPVHDVQVDVAEPGMPEAARDRTDDREPERLPQRHGRLVRTDDGVELHAPVPACPGARDDLLGEPATDAPPARRGGHHEASVGDVCPERGLVGLEDGRTHDGLSVDGDPGLGRRGRHPQRAGGCLAGLRIPRVRLAGRHDLVPDRPDRRPVLVAGPTDLQLRHRDRR